MVGLVDREMENSKLQELWTRRGPAMALVYGRRRLGKTYFLQNFLQGRRGIYLLAADSTSNENLGELLEQVRIAFPDRHDATLANYPTWRTAMRLLCELAQDEPMLVVLDEFSYLIKADPSVPSVIQAIWDTDAKRTNIKLVLCGSELGTMSNLSDYGQPLHGRFDWMHRYGPLDYYDTARFIIAAAADAGVSPYHARDMLLVYGLYGGAGRYLDAIDAARPPSQNVTSLSLDPNGIFHNEGETLLRQEREIRDVAGYNTVLSTIAAGATGWGEILNQSHVEKNTLFAYLERLKSIGWITQERPFEEHDRRSIYRLADNMLKGWYRYVFRNRSALQTWRPADAWNRFVEPDLSTYMGFHAFEGVCHEHMRRFASRYSLPGIVEMGRWWTRDHQTEIDLVASLADGSYLFGECKWASSPVLTGDLNRLYRKVEAVPHAKWKQSARYVLFSAGEFDPLLIEVARRENVLLIDGNGLFPDLDIPLEPQGSRPAGD